jgi:hypothetical protein
VANRKSNGKSKSPHDASTYRHPEADSPLRPEVGTQAQFKKRKPPVTYRYDSSLSPALDYDGQNHAREASEALIGEIIEAKTLEDARAAAQRLKAMSAPFLNWAGKAERLSFEVPTLPLFVHERLSTKGIIETLKGHKLDPQLGLNLFGDPCRRHFFRAPAHGTTSRKLCAAPMMRRYGIIWRVPSAHHLRRTTTAKSQSK